MASTEGELEGRHESQEMASPDFGDTRRGLVGVVRGGPVGGERHFERAACPEGEK